ncbi:CHAP domain-containing protein [Enterococcus diestrammenae]|uniref:CHAP domain-containing protein n=1 Tax=Enterococcus diestrammenae TaxID=1155073 RepID=UPI003221B33A
MKSVAPWVGTYWGNGNQWGYSAAADGYRVDSSPEVGSVAVFAAGFAGANAVYGHVAYVESVNGDGTITISQGGMGFATPAGPNYRTMSASGLQFIHRY